jgi:hypothetical protein
MKIKHKITVSAFDPAHIARGHRATKHAPKFGDRRTKRQRTRAAQRRSWSKGD